MATAKLVLLATSLVCCTQLGMSLPVPTKRNPDVQGLLSPRRNGTALVAPTAEGTNTIDLINITAVDRDTLWAVANIVNWASTSETGGAGTEGRISQHNTGLLLHTTDGGQTWNKRLVVPGSFLSSVRFSPENVGYVCGDHGLVLSSTDGGSNWVKQTTPTTTTLWDVQFIGAHWGWMLGSDGEIIHTEDGGGHWMLQKVGTGDEVLYLSFGGKYNGWALGKKGDSYQSTDGGKTWRARGPEFFTLFASWGASMVEPRGVKFLSDKIGFIAANVLSKDNRCKSRVRPAILHGALAQDTNYSYSLVDKLTLVNQGNQTRAYKY